MPAPRQNIPVAITPAKARHLFDQYTKSRRLTPYEHRMGRRLIDFWRKRPAPADRAATLRNHHIWVVNNQNLKPDELPEIAHNAWVAWAIMKIDETVTVPVSIVADGQTFSRPRRMSGRGASDVTSQTLTDRIVGIVAGNRRNLPQDWRDPCWFPPNSGRIGTLSALLSSINRWGDKAPDVWRDALDTKNLPTTQRKLTMAFLDRALPPGEQGLDALLDLKQSVDHAYRLAIRLPDENIVDFSPIKPSALVWPCHAKHPTSSLIAPPLRSWLWAAAKGQPYDGEGASTEDLLAIRAEQGAKRGGIEKGFRAEPCFYQDITVRIVNAWIAAMAARRVVT